MERKKALENIKKLCSDNQRILFYLIACIFRKTFVMKLGIPFVHILLLDPLRKNTNTRLMSIYKSF